MSLNMKGRISEVFESIQGEGLYLGQKQLFIRFFGCNLNCKFCDTKLNYFKEYIPADLLAELKSFWNNCHWVTFTGGEPLLQSAFLKEILPLTRKNGLKNYLETNGTLTQNLEKVIGYLDIVAMDFKLPSSTGLNGFWNEHRQFLKLASRKEVFIKTVISNTTLEEDLREAIKLIKKVNSACVLVLQPNSYEGAGLLVEKLQRFKNTCLREGVTACVIPQLHKIVGAR